MKYTWAIIASTGLFAFIGFLAAWCAAAYSPAEASHREEFLLIVFFALPLGGAVAGLIVGCIAAVLGRRFGDSRSSEP